MSAGPDCDDSMVERDSYDRCRLTAWRADNSLLISTGLARAGTVAIRPRTKADVTVEKCILTEGVEDVEGIEVVNRRTACSRRTEKRVESIDEEENGREGKSWKNWKRLQEKVMCCGMRL